jgi:hypothetical protein
MARSAFSIVKAASLRIVCLSFAALAVVPAVALAMPSRAEYGAWVYGRALFARVIAPQGYVYAHGEGHEYGTFSSGCAIPEAPTETCTLYYEYLVYTLPIPGLVPTDGEPGRNASCTQTIRIRDLEWPGALAKAREAHEFISGEVRAYSYHGGAVVCDGGGVRTVYAGDPDAPPAPPRVPTTVSVFRGQITRGGKILLKMRGPTPVLVGVSFNLQNRCRDGTVDTFGTSALSPTDTEPIRNGAFRLGVLGRPDRFSKASQTLFKGVIDGSHAKGTVVSVERSRRHGLCKSGTLSWTARVH